LSDGTTLSQLAVQGFLLKQPARYTELGARPTGDLHMRWIGFCADLLMAVCGVILLLYAYRVLGKPPGADEKYDAAVVRHAPTQKIVGWIIVAMAIVGLLDHLIGRG